MEVIDLTQDDKTDETDEPMVEDYLDSAGKKRIFRLSVYAAGNFLEAVELRDGEATGLRFILPVKPDELPPWGAMRDKIRERLSQRDLVRDEEGKLRDLRRVIRAQLSDEDRADSGTPVLLIDDMKVTWEDLGEYLMTYAGWGLRLEIRDCGDE